jgi:hypothetical protein
MTEKLLANAYIKGASDLLQGKIEGMPKIIIIPDGATNGDMVKAMFNITDNDIDEGLSTTYIYTKTRVLKGGSQDYLRERITFNRDWWNAPYNESGGVK